MNEFTQRAIRKFPHKAIDIAKSYDHKQVECKKWLVDTIIDLNIKFDWVYIAGSWYGNILVPMILKIFPNINRIKLHDIDEDVIRIARNIYFKDIDSVKADVQDSTTFEYHDAVINTSCEHMKPISCRPNTLLCLQSNNYKEIGEHTNCVNSVEELIEQYNMTEVLYTGERKFQKYTRYMVIGKK